MNTLWYKKPAEDWNNALPVGNGRLGGMVYGRPGHEIIDLNEESVWSGPYRDRNNTSCRENLGKIRELLDQGKVQEAQELGYECMTGLPSQEAVYQTAGKLHLDFYDEEHKGLVGPLSCRTGVFDDCCDYSRSLDLETSVVTTKFTMESSRPSTADLADNSRGSSITYTREVFSSALTDTLVVHVSASTPKSIYVRATLERGDYADRVVALADDTITLQDAHGIPFGTVVMAVANGGTVVTRGASIVVEGADTVTFYLDIETAWRHKHYRNKGGNTVRIGSSWCTWCTDRALKKVCYAASTLYSDVYDMHVADSVARYNQVEFSLGEESDLPTDELLAKGCSKALTELYWKYSRYLLISCSRDNGELPANLQGLWNKDMTPPWGCKYTININTEMNYWPANMCGAGDTEMVLFKHLARAYRHGKRTARVMYGLEDCYVAHHNLDIWGDTAPQDDWIPGTYWVFGAAWLATHIWEHYEYTQDKKFLRKYFYLMEDACKFFMQYMVPSKDGKHLVVSPSVSPENTYRLPSGETGSFSQGTDMDNRILEHLFTSTIKAAAVLGKNPSSTEMARMRNVLSKIEPPVITKEGTIREWPIECEEVEPGHRHISQLYGLFPGHSIEYYRNPELIAAADKTIQKRLANGGGHTGWSQAWIMNFRASLHQGEEAYKSLSALFAKSTLPNLFDNHPPFQIDGNFGTLAAVTRMIVQSEIVNDKVQIDFMGALPSQWTEGKLKGVSIKGNLKLDLEWKDNKITTGRLYANSVNHIQNVVICYGGKKYESWLDNGTLDVIHVLPSTLVDKQ